MQSYKKEEIKIAIILSILIDLCIINIPCFIFFHSLFDVISLSFLYAASGERIFMDRLIVLIKKVRQKRNSILTKREKNQKEVF